MEKVKKIEMAQTIITALFNKKTLVTEENSPAIWKSWVLKMAKHKKEDMAYQYEIAKRILENN